MSKLHNASSERIEQLKSEAAAMFCPLLLREALRRLSRLQGRECLAAFEKSMAAQIDDIKGDIPHLEDLKDLAVEQLYAAVKEAMDHPDAKQPLENPVGRRTLGRSEESGTLEEQLQSGLEDTFPASDPPAVVSTTISGSAKEIVGVEEHLRRRSETDIRR